MDEMILAAWALEVAALVRARRAMLEKRMVVFWVWFEVRVFLMCVEWW